MLPEDIARVCHEVNRAYCEAIGDKTQLPWSQAPDWQKESAIKGVKHKLEFEATPEQMHDNWVKDKIDAGWVYGPTKDAGNKTHPCIVPYDQLPQEQRVKDYLFSAVVDSLI